MAWPLLDPLGRDEIVADQFLTGLDSNARHVQVAATGVRRIEDLMQIARSLEAVEGQEANHERQRRGSAQTRFPEEEGYEADAARISDRVGIRNGVHPPQGPNV